MRKKIILLLMTVFLSAAAVHAVRWNLHSKEVSLTQARSEFKWKLKRILTSEQYNKLENHLAAMEIRHQHFPQNDDQADAMVEDWSNYLLLTANQEEKFHVAALMYLHQRNQIFQEPSRY